jgi:hypothetical protein
MRVSWVLGWLGTWHIVAACGPGLAPQSPSPKRPGVPPPSDQAGFRALLVAPVANGGLWFEDPTCQARFGSPGKIEPDAFDVFAQCVAGLHLRPTGREDEIDDTSVLTDDAGFELQAQVVDGRLRFIGFSGRAPGTPDLPTITPVALESLRIAGDPDATLSTETASRVILPGLPGLPGSPQPTHTHTEHLRLCLDETGQLREVMPASTTRHATAAAFAEVARTWRFRPFVVAGRPMAVCSIVGFQYPPDPRDAERDRLPRPPQRSRAET